MMQAGPRPLLGSLLVGEGHVSIEDLRRMLTVQRERRRPLGEIAVELGYVTEDVLRRLMARQGLYEERARLLGPQGSSEAAVGESDLPHLLDGVILRAMWAGATEVHLDPLEEGVAMRFRVRGELQDAGWLRMPRRGASELAAAISGLDPSDLVVLRESRATLPVARGRVEVGVSTDTTPTGTTVILHLYPDRAEDLTFSRLGFPAEIERECLNALERPVGAVLVAGSPGSGRSTTLCASVDVLDPDSRSIVGLGTGGAVPAPGVAWIPVEGSEDAVRALRWALADRPDVLLVDPLLDLRTVELAFEGAVRGIRLLASLDAPDALGAVVALLGMGVEPTLVGSALRLVVAQRLIREICPGCRVPETAERAGAYRRRIPQLRGGPPPRLYRGMGCSDCEGTGYTGTTVIAEMLLVTDEVRRAIVSGDPARLEGAARRQGMRTLLDDGLDKVRAGITSVDEILRALDLDG